ncbi:hypothetical protein [Rudaea cellulosilytica]|uniref:hypothetical protein n=1 Tax=Rudaea cellulosilytica TaxID=540746 RepID=UPI00037446D1|nr:hypothetical protein [Rudaea cellulosilytica]
MRRIVGLALSLLALSAIAAETTPTLEERMSKGEFHAAGLDKLSPAELKSLNDWLSGHAIVKTITKIETPTGKPVFETDQGQRQVIETRITGRFTGWYGKTIFRLDNGQEWTQAESGQMSNGKYDNPKVKIKPMLLGSWLLYVEPCGCSVRVERTK